MPPSTGYARGNRRRRETEPHVFPHNANAFVWFVKNRFALLDGYVHETEHADEPREAIEARFAEATRQGKRWMAARLVVTVLLAFGAVAAAIALVFAAVPGLRAVAEPVEGWLETLAAWAGSASALLLGLRFLIMRVLVRYEVGTQYLASRLTPEAEGTR